MKRCAILLSTLFLGTIVCGDDWPQFRGPNRDGASAEKGFKTVWPKEGPEKLWQASVGIGWSSIAVADGRAYTMGNDKETDTVFCFDAKDGKVIWKHSYPCTGKDPNGYMGPRMTPTVDGDRVYSVSREGHLFCLNARDGKVVWSKDYQKDFGAKPPTWGWSGSPLVEADLLIAEVGAKGAGVIAFNKKTGKELWRSGDEIAGYASPVAYTQKGERLVMTFSAFGLESRKVKGGQIAWQFPWKTKYDVNAATPLIVGDKVFVASAYGVGGGVLDISGAEPKVVWQGKHMAVHMSGAVYWEGHLYGFDEYTLRCADFNTGEVKWGEGKFKKGSLMLADGKLIIFGAEGQLGLAEASPAGCKELAIAQPIGGKDTWAPPVLANGIIYLRSKETLIAVDVRGHANAGGAGQIQSGAAASARQWQPLFPTNGVPKGWRVSEWSDVSKPAAAGVEWKVIDGVLHGSNPRGTWLISEKQYSDFELEFEWKIGERGNSGCGLRFPSAGDPAFDGLELQMCDPRYYPDDQRPSIPPSELTGGLYRAIAPTKNTFKPEQWNKYHVKLIGQKVEVHLNGEKIQDVNLADHTIVIKRHNGEDAVPMKDRPLKGHIGFQELSRGGGHVEIRNARIKELN